MSGRLPTQSAPGYRGSARKPSRNPGLGGNGVRNGDFEEAPQAGVEGAVGIGLRRPARREPDRQEGDRSAHHRRGQEDHPVAGPHLIAYETGLRPIAYNTDPGSPPVLSDADGIAPDGLAAVSYLKPLNPSDLHAADGQQGGTGGVCPGDLVSDGLNGHQ